MNKYLEENFLYKDLTHSIIGAAMAIHSELVPGFMERTYLNALKIELQHGNIPFEANFNIKVYYKSNLISEHFLDVFVDHKVILELKAVENLCNAHEAQIISYMKAAKCKIGLLMNFSKESLQWKRIILKDSLLR